MDGEIPPAMLPIAMTKPNEIARCTFSGDVVDVDVVVVDDDDDNEEDDEAMEAVTALEIHAKKQGFEAHMPVVAPQMINT
jgi:hypothetical protein